MNWKKIPNFSRYLTNELGEVKNVISGEILKGCTNPFGYFNYGLTDDSGKKTTMGRHRLLGIVYLEMPEGYSLDELEINHLNCIPGDDRLDNLAWVTGQQNCEWAGLHGSPKCLPVQVRDSKTGKIMEFPSFRECSRNLPLSKDQVALRAKSEGQIIYADGLQFKLASSTKGWGTEKAFVREKGILLRHALTEEIIALPSFLTASKLLDISPATITKYVRTQALHSSMYQLKRNTPDIKWRPLEDITLELEFSENRRGVVSDVDGVRLYHKSCIECAKYFGLKPTNLNHKLQNPPKDKSKIKFRYYSDMLQGSPNTE